MKIALICESMTDLRYFLPLCRTLDRIERDINVYLYYTSSGKYNAVDRNLEVFLSILSQGSFSNIRISHISNLNISRSIFDFLFTVEGINTFNLKPGKENKPTISDTIKFKKRFCIQHGFDYLNFASSDKEYIVTSKCYSDDLIDRFSCKSFISEIPISFWDIEDQLSLIEKGFKDKFSEKSVCIFYPEKGYHNEVLDIINFLIEKQYNIIIKQRKKNQGIPREYLNHQNIFVSFDNLWYPSESIIGPAVTNFAIGFGTSAYFELAPAGVKYIDVAIPEYSKPFKVINSDQDVPFNKRGYVKPELDNFICITEDYTTSCFRAIENLESQETNVTFENFRSDSYKFLKNLLNS